MSNEIKRMNYYNGLLLKKEDMTLDQDYHTRLHRMHNGCFHNWGIIVGLELEKIEGAPQIKVSQGLAFNRIKEDENTVYGQEIYIVDNHPDNPLDLSQYDPKDEIYITVCYEEVKADFDTLKGDEEIHIWERAKINHSSKKPEDPQKDIVLGRVKLTLDESGNKIIDYISDEDVADADGITSRLRKDAAPLGGELRTSKLSVGPHEEEEYNLPYICGLIDDKTNQLSGIDVRSAMTRFTGSINSGSINAKGNMDIEGGFTVTQNGEQTLNVNPTGKVDVAGEMDIGGSLKVSGGIAVTGEDAEIITPKLTVNNNMFTVNKYTPEKDEIDPRVQNSGFEVYRGSGFPVASLIWDESQKKWKASVIKTVKKIVDDQEIETEEMDLFDIAYGTSWDNMHNGSFVDEMHKHTMLWSEDNKPALNVDNDGNINVEKSINVVGSVAPQEGILAPSNGTDPVGKIMWNEEEKCWQAGTEGDMTNIPYGDNWKNLTKGDNADSLHTHSQFYNHDKSKVAMKINDAGDIDIPGELTVADKLTVIGDLDVLGTATIVNEVKLEVTDHVIVVNKHENDTPIISEAGLEVYRGKEPNARLVWDESLNKWRMGVGDSLQDIPSGDDWVELTDGMVVEDLHKHTKLCASSGDDVITVNDQGNTEIKGETEIKGLLIADSGTDIKGSMEVEGDVSIQGNLTVSGVTTTVKKESIEVSDNVIVVNKYSENEESIQNEAGLEVYRGGSTGNARLIWDETSAKWMIGNGEELWDIPYGDKWNSLTSKVNSDELHSHGKLCDGIGNTILSVDDAGDVLMEGDSTIKGSLNIGGIVTIDGDLLVNGTTIKKDELEVKDNMIILNKYEGEVSPANQSGIEVYRGESEEKACIVWDENAGKWRIGIGDELHDIAFGDSIKNLTNESNADFLHMHSQIYNPNGDILALSSSAAGNTEVLHNLNVGSNLTVNGNIDVRGSTASINTEKLDVRSSFITVNRYDQLDVGVNSKGGLEVYRGGTEPNAQILWDEEIQEWKMGVSGKSLLSIKNDGNIEAATINTDSVNIMKNGLILVKGGLEVPIDAGTKAQICWDSEYNNWKIGTNLATGVSISNEGNVGIGANSPNPDYRFYVSGDANISGKAVVDDIVINNKMELKGNIALENGFVESNSFQTKYKDINDNDAYAKLYWKWNNEEGTGKWFMEGGGNVSEIPTLDHEHTKLYGKNGENIVVNVVGKDEYVGIGNATPEEKLHVTGSVKVSERVIAKKAEFNSAVIDDLTMKSVNISGVLTTDGVIEAKSSADNKPQLKWDEEKGRWLAGVAGSLKVLSCEGDSNEELYGSNGEIAIKFEKDSVNVKKNLIVNGDLTVNGEVVAINTSTLNVEDSIIEINRYSPQPKPLDKNSGIEVFRGGTVGNAKLIWNEKLEMWQAGDGTTVRRISLDGHEHKINKLYNTDYKIEALRVDAEGNISITKKLDVTGDTVLQGGLKVSEINVEGGMNVALADNKKATLGWNAENKKWEAGDGDEVKGISLEGHIHEINRLHNTDGKIEALSVNAEGNITIAKKLDIKGDIVLEGGLKASEINVESGMNVALADDKKATLAWNSKNNRWEAGNGGTAKGISLEGHTHKINKLHNTDGKIEALSVNTEGNIAITKKLDVKGDIVLDGGLKASEINVGQVCAQKITQNATSDLYSENSLLTKEKAEKLFESLNPVVYKLKSDTEDRENVGFVTDEMDQIFKTSDAKAVSVVDIVGVLTALVKDQKKEIKELKDNLADITTKVTELQNPTQP